MFVQVLFGVSRTRRLLFTGVAILLEAEASPDGDVGNMSAPIFLAAVDGYLDGVELLTRYGALLTRSPHHRFSQPPVFTTIAYNRYNCYKFLVLTGFKRKLHQLADSKTDWDLLPHKIMLAKSLGDVRNKYIVLLSELGLADAGIFQGRVLEDEDRELKSLFESPRKLLSLCRLNILEADLDVSPLPVELQRYARFERVRDPWTADEQS